MKDSNLVPLNGSSYYDPRGNGVVYTPLPVARVVVAQAMAKSTTSGVKTVLEPSCGEGSFLSALAPQETVQVFALDKDHEAIARCETEFSEVSLFNGDFFDDLPNAWPKQYDFVLGNPPYVRWHRCKESTRIKLDDLCVEHDYQSSQLKNVWAGFVVKATKKLTPTGVLAFVIPYEFLTVSYGKHLKKWMEGQFTSIDIYVPDEKAFKAIDQDAVTIVAKKGEHVCKTTIHRVSSLADNRTKASCLVSGGNRTDSALTMKGFLLDSDALELIDKLQSRCSKLSDLCDNAAGTVTAANDFFILSREDVSQHRLKRWARPIVKKSGFLGDSVNFTKANFEDIESSGKACYLLDFSKLDAERLPKAVEHYVALGEGQGLHLRYKCRHRTHWFQVPIVAPNDGFFFKRSHVVPRLCVNSCGALATDSAYHIRMKSDRDIKSMCASFYNSLTLLYAEIEGRFYGGGVLELTPNEFRGLPLQYNEFSEEDFVDFQGRFTLADNGWSAVQFANERLRSSLGLSQEDVAHLEIARECLQAHRLRHGRKGN